MPEIKARWLRDVRTGQDILVTAKDMQENTEYRNALRYVRLDKPVPPDTPDAVMNVKRTKRRTNLKEPAKKKAAAKKPAAKKKAAK